MPGHSALVEVDMLIGISGGVSVQNVLSDEFVGGLEWFNMFPSESDCVDERARLQEVHEEDIWSHFKSLVLGWGSQTCSLSLEDFPSDGIRTEFMRDLPTIVIGMLKRFALQLAGCWHKVLLEAIGHFLEGWPFSHRDKVGGL
ncbi:hypothetical protein LB504_009688 [Fusarium proliferatum]|nr:hypothetical protein LB504_009688 [Fusarium proliferatum]